MTLTRDSLDLFVELAEWAGDWSGNPLIDITPAQRGNLSHLKRAGLLVTFESDDCMFASFTEAGIALAGQHGVDLTWIDEMARAS